MSHVRVPFHVIEEHTSKFDTLQVTHEQVAVDSVAVAVAVAVERG